MIWKDFLASASGRSEHPAVLCDEGVISYSELLARGDVVARTMPAAPFDACDQAAGQVNSQSLVRYKTNDYSVPVAYGHRDVWLRGYVDQVVIGCGGEVIARHPRCRLMQPRWLSFVEAVTNIVVGYGRAEALPATRQHQPVLTLIDAVLSS